MVNFTPNPGEDPEAFKQRIGKQELRRARMVATWMGICGIVAVISVSFGMIQRDVIKAERVQLEQSAVSLKQCSLEMAEYKKRVEASNQVLETALRDAREARKQAEAEYQNALKRERK